MYRVGAEGAVLQPGGFQVRGDLPVAAHQRTSQSGSGKPSAATFTTYGR